jgi:hypothetical protein
VHPIGQEFPTIVKRSRPSDYEATQSATLSASYRRGGLDPLVTVLALVEGFGPGWSAEEVCELALDAVRTTLLGADEESPADLLHACLSAANSAVHGRASAYSAVSEIGARLVVVLVAGGRCYLAQAGGNAAFLREREGGFRSIDPILTAEEDNFLGADADIPLSPAEEQKGVRLMAGDLLVLVNDALLPALEQAGDRFTEKLAKLPLETAAERLVALGGVDSQRERTVLLMEMPSAVRRVAVLLPRLGRPSVLLGAGALVLVALLVWAGASVFRRPEEPPATPSPSPLPSATIYLAPPPTDLPHLPTPARTATYTPTPTETPTVTPTPTNTPTPVPPSETPTPTDTPTVTFTPSSTPVSPTPTATIPVAPIRVGGVVVVTGTEGMGVSGRVEPRLRALRLFVLLDGEQLWVIDGPETVGDSTWWKLRRANGAEGWVVERFLQGVANR